MNRVKWHPERFLSTLNSDLFVRLEESANVVKDEAQTLCPVRTGNLQNSIDQTTNKEELTAYIGSDVLYSIFVEIGTRKQKAQPYLRTGLMASVNKIRQIFSGK